jgi:hypothetical protein
MDMRIRRHAKVAQHPLHGGWLDADRPSTDEEVYAAHVRCAGTGTG